MDEVGTITATLVFGALVLKSVDFLKYLKTGIAGEGWNGFVTLLLGFVAGIVAVQLILWTQWGDEIKIGNESLEGLTFASQIVLGLVATSVAAVIYDFKKAVDNTDTAGTPRLTTSQPDLEARIERRQPAPTVIRPST